MAHGISTILATVLSYPLKEVPPSLKRALFPILPCIQSAPELKEADVPLPCVVPIAVERKNEDVIILN